MILDDDDDDDAVSSINSTPSPVSRLYTLMAA